MIRRAWIEADEPGRSRPEQASVREELARRGVPVASFERRALRRLDDALRPDDLVVGSLPSVFHALGRLGVEAPAPFDYPAALQAFLGRRVWPSTVREVARGLQRSTLGPTFVKPRAHHKRFTGFVAIDRGALAHVEAWGGSMPVWCSDPVTWRSEWRVFVLRGQTVGHRRYAGDDGALDEAVVARAVAAWREDGAMPAACAMDFGRLDDGRTALIEVNDAFALGAYGLDGAVYVDLLVARWEELVGASPRGMTR